MSKVQKKDVVKKQFAITRTSRSVTIGTEKIETLGRRDSEEESLSKEETEEEDAQYEEAHEERSKPK